MCCGCYEEYGSPNARHEETDRLVELLPSVNPFGALHIVVDDWNLEDEHIEFCKGQPDAEDIDLEVADIMLRMTVEQRATAMGIVDGYCR